MKNKNISSKAMFSTEELIYSSPEYFIEPRIVDRRETLILGGSPKVGKSDFLLTWMAHMASGLAFIEMLPPKPMRVLYLHTGIDRDELADRLRNLMIGKRDLALAEINMAFLLSTTMHLNSQEIEDIYQSAQGYFKDAKVDIIVIDSWNYKGVNNEKEYEDEMRIFLTNNLEALRKRINPEARIILTHNFKSSAEELANLRPFLYLSQITMERSDLNESARILLFDLLYENNLSPKLVEKQDGRWYEIESEDAKTHNSRLQEKFKW